MIVLRAIGAFFARIWRWIRETAWVQPLLIVGLIFGVMFSIKPIYEAIKNANNKANSAETYYRRFQASLAGGDKSAASKLTDQILDSMDEQQNLVDSSYNLGDKFFLMYVAESCDRCTAAKGGFEYLEENLGTASYPSDEPFKLVTIFQDEVMTDGSDSDETAFVKYMESHVRFFEDVGGLIWDSPYYLDAKGITQDEISAIEQADPSEFITPTIMLVNLKTSSDNPYIGVTDVFVDVVEEGNSGNSDANRAQFLYDAWTSQGKFERK